MRKSIVFLVAILSISYPVFAEDYLLLGVVDGDTIVIYKDKYVEQVHIRNIDAPEIDQNFGVDSWRFLKSKLAGQDKVTIQNYSHGMADVILPGSINSATYLVAEGYAWCDEKDKSMNGSMLKKLQDEARLQRKGLWATEKVEVKEYMIVAQSPWKWREDHPKSDLNIVYRDSDALDKLENINNFRAFGGDKSDVKAYINKSFDGAPVNRYEVRIR